MPATPSPRRNDPCPCGSNRRFKDCHGRLEKGQALLAAHRARGIGDLESAKALVANALRGPDEIEGLDLAGMISHDLLDLEAAEHFFRLALQKAPTFAEAHYHLSICLLMRGAYTEGWKEYAWRTAIPGPANFANYDFGIPRWAGEPLAGRRILIHAEQGHGDTIQFARFLAKLAGEGAQVDLFCHAPLVPLLSRLPGVGSVVSQLLERPSHDFHAAIGDLLPHYLPTPDSTHWHAPYVWPHEATHTRWAGELGRLPRPRVGLVWRGNPMHVNDRNRSLAAEEARRLVVPGVTYIGLQVPHTTLGVQGVVELGSRISSWEDTCAIVDALDLVVTVDTAVAHLAGAMGKRVWVLVPYCPDWRWRLHSSETPWYPGMRLFRQNAPGLWSDVVQQVATRVSRELVAAT